MVINYTDNNNESQSSTSSKKEKLKLNEDLDNQLDLIEEKYTKINTQSSKKRKFINFKPNTNLLKNTSLSSSVFIDAVNEIRTGDSANESIVQENSNKMINSQNIDSD
ncbi:17420_t:CDS:2 [Cetraspora pellucida]|uniref:17420_t:CDS:1 n=1 Tax=Cetraspora pellucida TaxID=1433469 RepID=A0ACA9KFQ0_9GLOM|nr:17420_t:CDS:2 [Cetraspora pellucida]